MTAGLLLADERPDPALLDALREAAADLTVAARPAALTGCTVTVGVRSRPGPAPAALHERLRAELPTARYHGVEAWHGHPGWIAALADAVAGAQAGGAPDDAHVLFTAEGPREDPEPAEVVFLRQTAEAISERLRLPRRSIAWTGGRTRPTVGTVLAALADAHGRRHVVWVPVEPGAPGADEVDAAARGNQVHVTTATVALPVVADVLTAVVRTVLERAA